MPISSAHVHCQLTSLYQESKTTASKMCNQTYYDYSCGCREKGQFVQCQAEWDRNSMLKCPNTHVLPDSQDIRNLCAKLLLARDKAKIRFTQREQNT